MVLIKKLTLVCADIRFSFNFSAKPRTWLTRNVEIVERKNGRVKMLNWLKKTEGSCVVGFPNISRKWIHLAVRISVLFMHSQ
jgi:hypothetical protein